MARKTSEDSGEQVRHVTTNGFDSDALKTYTSDIEKHLDQIDSERGEFMRRCKSIREEIALVVQQAKDQHGIPKKEFKAVIKTRELEAKAARIRDDMEGDAQDTFDQIRHALGDLVDTPLGGAALAKASDRPSA